MFFIFTFLVLYVYLVFRFLKYLILFKRGLVDLESQDILMEDKFPLNGKKIDDYLNVSLEHNSKALILFLLPGCAPCDPSIERLRYHIIREGYVPSTLVIVEKKGKEVYQEKYSEHFDIQFDEPEIINPLMIYGYPQACIINEENIVIACPGDISSAYYMVRNSIMQKDEKEVIANA